ncbi:hypothetical protein [Actinomadura rudentiformis]|uniref:Uncharacterized protein n=1 Tax=Actinomadura rudentiformis TaxID=359158 RepID=A0A6H9Z3A9_9ACTN|nr:hypothetical protein [Actinomadura rudentiformis]KAB2348927.1 hypothetical protein F8566_14305 [Actinomadura rudentiformis]
MAPPQFPMYSPSPFPGDGGRIAEPVFGASRADDPGFAASMRSGTLLGRLRTMMLVLLVAPVLIAAITPLIVQDGKGRLGDAPWWFYLPLAAGVLLAVLVGPRVPRPMEPGQERMAAVETAMLQFRQALLLRFALTEGIILLGLPLAMIGHSELLFAVGFVLGYPLMIWLALPTTGTIEGIRRRLESGGAEAHLWAGFLARASRGKPPQS